MHSPSTCKTSFCFVEFGPGLMPGPFLFHAHCFAIAHTQAIAKFGKQTHPALFGIAPQPAKLRFALSNPAPGSRRGLFFFHAHCFAIARTQAIARFGKQAAAQAGRLRSQCSSISGHANPCGPQKNPGKIRDFLKAHGAIFTFSAAFSGAPTSLPSGGSAGAFPRAGALRRSSSQLQSIFRPLPF